MRLRTAFHCACVVGFLATIGEPGRSLAEEPPAPTSDPQVTLAEAKARATKHPKDLDALFHLGLAWQGAHQPDSAAAVFAAILEKDPDNVKALVHEGLSLEDLNKHEQAEALYRRAIEIAPRDPLPYVNLGSLLYFHSKKTYEAKTALTKALELDPNSPDAHFNLGVLFADASLYREAKVEWEAVLSLVKEGPAASLAKENLDRIRPLMDEGDSAAPQSGDEHAHP